MVDATNMTGDFVGYEEAYVHRNIKNFGVPESYTVTSNVYWLFIGICLQV